MADISSEPLGYLGISQRSQPFFKSLDRAPNANDYQSFMPGDQVLDTSEDPADIYECVSVEDNQAIWRKITNEGEDGVIKLTPSSGSMPVLPDTTGNINITAGAGITTVGSANTITINATSGGGHLDTLTGNSGGAVSPSSGNIDVLGQGSIDIVGTPASNKLDVSLTGITDHAVIVGGSSNTLNNKLLTDGQVVIGSTGVDPVAASLTAGTNITITPGAGSIEIAATGGGSGDVDTLEGNSGGKVSADGTGNIQTLGKGSITVVGTPASNKLEAELTGLTDHNILLGQGTDTIGLVAPTSTSGIPLISKGSSADPDFDTAEVPGGGTGKTSLVAYAVMCGGTTSTNPVQQVPTLGTSGQVLTSQGAGSLPQWATGSGGSGFTEVKRTIFTTNGTFTADANLSYALIECIGAGGAGGGTSNAAGAQGGGGGGGGEYRSGYFDSATIGASQTVTIGVGGTGAGGNTSVGSLVVANGGSLADSASSAGFTGGGPGGTGGSGGDLNINGSQGFFGLGFVITGGGAAIGQGGYGGAAPSYSASTAQTNLYDSNTSSAGIDGVLYGSGGSGAVMASSSITQPARSGGNGADGIVVITEYII